MTVETSEQLTLKILQEKATQLRIDSVRATTEAGSGHPTSCASAAEIMSVLFYSVMRYDSHDPRRPDSDLFVLSKVHAAPILYAAWSEAGAFPREKLLTLRKIHSDLEGHPITLLPFVDVATGSLGQGLSVGVGIALNAKRFGDPPALLISLDRGFPIAAESAAPARRAYQILHFAFTGAHRLCHVDAVSQNAAWM